MSRARRVWVVIGVGVVVAAAVLFARTGPFGRYGDNGPSCETFTFTHNGVPWKATRVRIAGLSCNDATSVIKAYAKPSNCQFRPSCHVDGYSCRTLATEGSTFTEHCTQGHRSVRWHGSYVSS